MIDKNKAKRVHEDFAREIKQFAKKNGLKGSIGQARYSDSEIRLSCVLVDLERDSESLYVDENTLRFGMAKPGSKALFNNELVTINRAKQSKYSFSFDKNLEKNYVAAFDGFKPVPKDKQ